MPFVTGPDGVERLVGDRALAVVRRTSAGDATWLAVDPEPDADPAAVAAALLRAAPGSQVATKDGPLLAALVAAGGTVRRRGREYTLDLAAGVPEGWADPSLPEGLAVAPLAEVSDDLVAAHEAAYPPGHVDHEPGFDHRQDLADMLAGRVVGRLVPEATWQILERGRARGAVLVMERPAAGLSSGGLWVCDVFVHPAGHGRGLGGALLRRSLAGAASTGHPRAGLIVTDGNPARAVYEALGFRLVAAGGTVDLPR